jgi:hypothetical protein
MFATTNVLLRCIQTVDNKNYYQGSFWDIIRDGDYYPSLSRFQFMLWTVVISFIFPSIHLLRIFGAVTSAPPASIDTREYSSVDGD